MLFNVMVHYNISINDELAELVEQMMKHGRYANRSEFFRDLIRKAYLNNDCIIEELHPDDPDYKLLQAEKRFENNEFVPLETILKKSLDDVQNSL